MLNFVLCDDNLNILNKLGSMLESLFIKHNYNATIALKTSNADEVLQYVNSYPVNVLFLDIHLESNISGLDLAKIIRKTNKSIYIIFSTCHLEYALLAYKVKTFDYIPKPFTIEKLEETLLRLYSDMKELPKEYLTLNSKSIIDQNDIQYLKKEGTKLIVYTNNSRYETYSSFNKIQECLPENFVRCHKSYIANINNIKDIQANNNTIKFETHECYIGPKYKNNFMEVFNNYGNFTNNLEYSNNTK
jgi:DNA-binding LytR/AlgR family response regulator